MLVIYSTDKGIEAVGKSLIHLIEDYSRSRGRPYEDSPLDEHHLDGREQASIMVEVYDVGDTDHALREEYEDDIVGVKSQALKLWYIVDEK